MTDTVTTVPSITRRPRNRRNKPTSGSPCVKPCGVEPIATPIAKLATILRPSKRTGTLTLDGTSPHKINISGNWGAERSQGRDLGAVVEMVTRGTPGGAHMSTRLTRNTTFSLPTGTTRVDLWVTEGCEGVSLNVTAEPASELLMWPGGSLRHEYIARKYANH